MPKSVLHELRFVADTNNNLIEDVSSGGTFTFAGRSDVHCISVAAGTKKLPDAGIGTRATFTAAGAVTLTNSAGTTVGGMVSGETMTVIVSSRTSAGVSTWKVIGVSASDSMQTTLETAYGIVPIPLTQWRETGTDDTLAAVPGAGLGAGGVMGTDSTPAFEYVNGDTDSTLRILWAASGAQPIVTQIMLPYDVDITLPIYFNALGKMSGAADTPVIAIDAYFLDESGTVTAKTEENTSAFGATAAVKSASFAVSSYTDGISTPRFATFELTPGSHGTDSLALYGTFVQYTKKLLTS